jgi:hypothetical protein
MSGAEDAGMHVEIQGAQGSQIGHGNVQYNTWIIGSRGGVAAGPVVAGDVIIVGEIPQEAMAFDQRHELQDMLTANYAAPVHMPDASNVSVIVGMRGVGKSQLASAIARKRLADGWSAVAWVNAEDMGQLTLGLHHLAVELRLSSEDSDPYESAMRVRHWLEADADKFLLVLDNAADADILRHFVPVRSRAQIIITGSNRTLASLGKPVEVSVFTPDEAVNFLTTRTGIPDHKGALQVASDLGYLPLALAQAASVITGQKLNYTTYRERLKGSDLGEYLYRTADDPYPRGVVSAILLTLDAVTAGDDAKVCRQLTEFTAFLSPAGIRRTRLYAAVGGSPSEVDAALHSLVNSSLLTWVGADGSAVTMHHLIARVVRERAINDSTMPSAADRISRVFLSAINNDGNDISTVAADIVSSRMLLRIFLMMAPKLPRLIRANEPVEGLTPGEDNCIFALVENFAPTYKKLKFGIRTRLESMEYWRDGQVVGARLSHARALENSGHLKDAAQAYKLLLADLNREDLIANSIAKTVRRDLARIHDQLAK